ncbi:olfactory receptor 56-like [Octodon degus]|uniref:Olfactory receptor n=1 Tax=Octodon degus TaxID=10160 RepID=A0A6P3VCX1_OCTDE|nr:olfactory receptor 56-like [Octodon degus]
MACWHVTQRSVWTLSENPPALDIKVVPESPLEKNGSRRNALVFSTAYIHQNLASQLHRLSCSTPGGVSAAVRALDLPTDRLQHERSLKSKSTAKFVLLGLFPGLRQANCLVSAVLLIYAVALTANSMLILLIWVDAHLHTPMYFLLSQLALMDLTLISSTVPKMATDFFSGKRNISRVACGTQIFFFLTLGIAECILITLMAYDRYVAVCDPLRYALIMSPKVCLQMAAIAWAGGALTSLAHTAYAMHFPICGSREIAHFLCEVMAILKLVCEDISAYEKAVLVTSTVVLLIPLSFILTSYALIFLAVHRINSTQGRNKALATCSSHLIVVSLYFGPAMLVYMRPTSYHRPTLDQVLFMLGAILTPTMNPLVYSLRNKEVMCALKKVLGDCLSSS